MNSPRHAFVTGAASGIGLATAELLLRQGWQVAGLDRQPRPDSVAAADWSLCDLADPPRIEAACALPWLGDVTVIFEKFGPTSKPEGGSGSTFPPIMARAGLTGWPVPRWR